PASTPQAGQSAQPRQAPPASQPYTAQPQQNAPFHGGGNGNGFHGNGNGGNGSGGPRRRKKGGAGKYIAVALVCALCGGLVGGIFGGGIGQYLFRASTTVHVSDRTVSDVKEVKVDGQTEMSNAEN